MRKLWMLLSVAAALTWSACGDSNNSKISYMVNESGNNVLYTLSADGKTSTKSTITPPSDGFYFVANSDATLLAYCKFDQNSGLTNIYTMDQKGTETQLTTSDSCYPSFSRDGRLIVYNVYESGTIKIYSMNVDGSNQKLVYGSTNGNEYNPVYSPNGSLIAFYHEDYSATRTQMGANAWSQRMQTLRTRAISGTRIQPSVTPGTGPNGLYYIKSDGTGFTEVLADPNYNFDSPVFSGDGKSLYFGSYDFGDNWQVASVKLDGTGLTNLSNDLNNEDYYPMAYGSQIIFNRYDCTTTCNLEIFSMNTDGSNKKNLTNTTSQDEYLQYYGLF